MRFRLFVATCMILPMLAACPSGQPAAGTPGASPTPTPAPVANQVTISNFSFSPTPMAVSAGTTVTWVNNDQATHTVTADDKSFDSGSLAPGRTFSFTFSTAGTVTYHCNFHPSMKGSVAVK